MDGRMKETIRMYPVTIELHATASKYWGRLEFVDTGGRTHTRDIKQDRESTVNSNAIQALIASMQVLQRPCILDIHTDNEYVANSITNGWAESWKQNEWRNAKGKVVPYKEQWQELMRLLSNHSRRFTIIKT